MKLKIILLLFVVAVIAFSLGSASASPPTFTSTAAITFTFGSSTVDQATADAQKAQFLLDYCNAKGLSTVNTSNSFVSDVKQTIKNTVVGYRADNAAATQRAIDVSGIQP